VIPFPCPSGSQEPSPPDAPQPAAGGAFPSGHSGSLVVVGQGCAFREAARISRSASVTARPRIAVETKAHAGSTVKGRSAGPTNPVVKSGSSWLARPAPWSSDTPIVDRSRLPQKPRRHAPAARAYAGTSSSSCRRPRAPIATPPNVAEPTAPRLADHQGARAPSAAQLRGPSARQQRHHQVGVQPIGRRLAKYVIDLPRSEGTSGVADPGGLSGRARPAPRLAGREVGQLHNIPLHLVPRHRPHDRSV
jgi:hypothetical protein